jgi:DNA-binding XRE family transcriptional regulator
MKGRPGSCPNGVGKVNGEKIVCPRCNGVGELEADSVSIGDRLRGLRDKTGKRQEDMAPELGVTRAQLANLEGDRSLPSVETLMNAAKTYKVSMDYLVGLKR